MGDFPKVVKLQAISHYPYEMLIEDASVKLFSNIKYSFIDANNLLKVFFLLFKVQIIYLANITCFIKARKRKLARFYCQRILSSFRIINVWLRCWKISK